MNQDSGNGGDNQTQTVRNCQQLIKKQQKTEYIETMWHNDSEYKHGTSPHQQKNSHYDDDLNQSLPLDQGNPIIGSHPGFHRGEAEETAPC